MSRTQRIGPENGDFYIQSKNPAAALTIVRVSTSMNDGVTIDERNKSGITFIKSGIISLNVSYSKSSPFHPFEAVLLPTQEHILSTVLPGDYCLIHIVNDKSVLDLIEKDVLDLKAINLEKYGFKGVFKIESVRQNYQIMHETGAKLLTYSISGYAFKELNSVIYYNPFLVFENEKNDVIVYMSRFAQTFSDLLSQTKLDGQKNDFIIQFLWSSFLGRGGPYKTDKKLPDTPNTVFITPPTLLSLMGVKTAANGQLKDLYLLKTGVHGYDSYEPKIKAPNLSVTVYLPQFWDQVPIWSILKGFENAPVDELFASFRKDNNGVIMPWVFYRQIPYSSAKIKIKTPVTYFHELPVWSVHDSLIMSYSIGRDDSHHINYVSVFSSAPAAPPEVNTMHMNYQVASKNFKSDVHDIQRHGLRSAIIVTRHDDILKEKKELYAKTFTEILADVMLNGHLKLNGTVQMFGVQEAITIGDNFMLNDTLFHIESVRHSFSVNPGNGNTSFMTTLGLSYGVKADASGSGVKFSRLRNTTIEKEKQTSPSLPAVNFNPIDINNDKVSEMSKQMTEEGVLGRIKNKIRGK